MTVPCAGFHLVTPFLTHTASLGRRSSAGNLMEDRTTALVGIATLLLAALLYILLGFAPDM
jgi:hypothetical protein